MTPSGIRILIAIIIALLFSVVFSAAWTWMKRYDEKAAELVKAKKDLKEAREAAETWRKIAEDITNAIEGRPA